MSKPTPAFLFMCVHNAGKSQTAAALMRHRVGNAANVYSAGTAPGASLSSEAVSALAEIGVGTGGEFPKPVDPEIFRAVNRVIVIGNEAVVSALDGMRGTIEPWLTIEPADQGIQGAERARLVRDDIRARVEELAKEFSL